MTAVNEPKLDIHDTQGHVFPGFGSVHSVVAAFRLSEPAPGRRSLGILLPEVTTMAAALRDRSSRRAALSAGQSIPDQPVASLAVAFSSSVLRAWGFPDDGYDESFRQGMVKDLRSLGDPIDQNDLPIDWAFGHTEETAIDMLLIGGHSSAEALETSFTHWRSLLEPGWQLVHADRAKRRTGDKEFFGFNDGISQPAIRGILPDGSTASTRTISEDDVRSTAFARPGQRLVWPGNFIFGYPREVSGSVDAGSVFDPPQPWMRNGSYLVYRRLNQDVAQFERAVEALRTHLTDQGFAVEAPWLGSRLVGRWPDGTPILMSPDSPDPTIGGDPLRHNNFQYQFAEPPVEVIGQNGVSRVIPTTPTDPRGALVPLSAHIRQINPRAGQSDEGAEVHPLKLMLRRGVTFGPEIEDDAAAERGLIFLSYQTSIVRQFLFLQQTWANSANAPTSAGPDPIIGQDRTDDPKRFIRLPMPNGSTRTCPFHGRWVIPTAGSYLFLPGIEGLRELSQQ